MKKVEQVDIDGNIVIDYDTSLSPNELYAKIEQSFPGIYKDKDGMICGEYKGESFAIRMKNITYLGHPHALYKKRIQIANDLQDFYRNALKWNRKPLLLGVYSYGGNTLFCNFNIEDFIEKKANNSSAHVYTSDLADATVDGYFYKEDAFGNKITVFKDSTVSAFLAEKLELNQEADSFEYRFDDAFENSIGAESPSEYNVDFEVDEIKKNVMGFIRSMPRIWTGIECYKAMIEADYRNKYQPEWPGFYLEYSFEHYLNDNKLTGIIQFAQGKTKGKIDLDLFFPKIHMYGDLKAHSSSSNAVQGNDWNTILGLINSPNRENHVYYIVCEHDTEKDSAHKFEVTHFWNTAQGKDDIMSYSKRMKNRVELTRVYIFDINANNKRFLSKFKQGLNSNGKPREPKIMIEHSNFAEFILAESKL